MKDWARVDRSRERAGEVERSSGVVIAREARRFPRKRIQLIARISSLQPEHDGEGAAYYVLSDARTLDVGDAGVGLEVDDGVPAGGRVLVEVEMADGSVLTRSATVMWTAEDAAQVSYLGLRFDEPIPGLAARI